MEFVEFDHTQTPCDRGAYKASASTPATRFEDRELTSLEVLTVPVAF